MTRSVTSWCLFLGFFVLYVGSIGRTAPFGDGAELAAAGATLGIPHPPGYAFFMILANAWVRLFSVGEPAFRLSVLCSLLGTGALVYVGKLLRDCGVGRTGVFAGIASLGLGHTFWSQVRIPEVYALDLLLFAFVLHPKRSWWSFCVGVALWVVHRPVNMVYLVAVVLISGRKVPTKWSTRAGGMVCATLTAITVLMYFPIASRAEPLIDTFNPESWIGFRTLVSSSSYWGYLMHGSFHDQAAWLLGCLSHDLGLFLLFVPFGIGACPKPIRFGVIFGIACCVSFAASYAVLDAHVFALPALLLTAIAVGFGANYLELRRAILLRMTVVLATTASVAVNATTVLERNNDLAASWGRIVLNSVEENALLVVHTDAFAYLPWYQQSVLGLRQDVLVAPRTRIGNWQVDQYRRRRPQLRIPYAVGEEGALRWVSDVLVSNKGVPIYTNMPTALFTRPQDHQRVRSQFEQIPAGLLYRLIPRDKLPEPSDVIDANLRFWHALLPSISRYDPSTLSHDQRVLWTHAVASSVFFAQYCLNHRDALAANEILESVVDLELGLATEKIVARLKPFGQTFVLAHIPRLARVLLVRSRQRLDAQD